MKRGTEFGVILFIALFVQPAVAALRSPCDCTGGWKQALCVFAEKETVHFAWGFEHGIRDYLLSMQLAQEEGIKADEEVLLAASLLHDLGGFPKYEVSGVDHALRSTQVVEPILLSVGFPAEKIEAVKAAILTHSYYEPALPPTAEAILLHDADTLDFLGVISAARLLSISGQEKGIESPQQAVDLLTRFQASLPAKLHGGRYTQELGQKRALELKNFLDSLKQETFSLGLPLPHSPNSATR